MIRSERNNDLLFVTLDRPQARNALSFELLAELANALSAAWLADARAVVIAGTGTVFSAGADLSELTGTATDIAMDDAIFAATSAIRAAAVPVVAAIDGPCIGGAVDIALACDLRVASERAYFQVPATRLGLLYNPDAVAFMHARLPRHALTRVLLMGERLDAHEALAVGLVTHLCGDTPCAQSASDLARGAAHNVGAAVAATKELLNDLDAGRYDPAEWVRRRREVLASPERAQAIADARKKGDSKRDN